MIDKLGENKQFIEIVKTGKEEKPYYNIKYLDRVTGKTHIGYSSYSLEVISQFLREDFIEQARWHKVEDELPDICEEVLVNDGSDMFVAWWANDGFESKWHSFDGRHDTNTPILAWTELPEWEE